ncbi:MAG: hypothetical protein WCA38_02135 [Candidatus Acidiferrales bacterium]
MTRRGSLVYYLASWALGCFFMVVVVWCLDMIQASRQDLLREATEGFLSLVVYGYLFGAPTALLFGLLLRRIMRTLSCKTPARWAAVGAILAPMLAVILALASRSIARILPSNYASILFLFVGADAVLKAGWWLAVPAGAATGYYLGRIQRVFTPLSETGRNFSA